jgi:hypothetical protein
MTETTNLNNAKGGGGRPLSLVFWGLLITILAAGAYLVGANLARRWAPPLLASPIEATTAGSRATAVVGEPVAAAQALEIGVPIDGELEETTIDRWRFQGIAGQSVTIEMWLHPGSGSSVDAELAVELIGPDGATLAQEAGSVFLPPYLSFTVLPATDSYVVQVSPTSGAPGRYSMLLTLSDPRAPRATGAPAEPRSPTLTPDNTAVAASAGMFQWPTVRRAISGWTFHDPRNPGHIGLDIAAVMWDPIYAAAEGVVTFSDWGGGYGNLVVVEHHGGWTTYYAHFTEIAVEVGQNVHQGQLLGGAGTTGYSTGPHLHFEIRYQGRPVDPHIYLP